MRIALSVPLITDDVEKNIHKIGAMTRSASAQKINLILFPEAVLTGLINCDIPEKDLGLCVTIPGPRTELIASIASDNGIFLGIGMLEKDGEKIYDTAVLFSPGGEYLMKYRRMQAQWHGKQADPLIYCEGQSITRAETEMGSFSFLICGDLFDDRIISLVKRKRPDYVLLPIARCFDDGTYDQERWDSKEKSAYAEQVKKIGITTLVTNYLADISMNNGSFGGAFVFDPKGNELKSYPLGKEGMLFVDV